MTTIETWRTCSICSERKPSIDFYKDKSKISGYRTDCKECSKAREKTAYKVVEGRAEAHRHKSKVRYDNGYRSPRLTTRA
jgi:hypothetical protein